MIGDTWPPLTEEQRGMVAANIGLAYAIAGDRWGRDNDDAIQDGMMGLMRAVQLFDPDKGFQFSSYASIYIKSLIARGARADRTIHVPSKVHFADPDVVAATATTAIGDLGWWIPDDHDGDVDKAMDDAGLVAAIESIVDGLSEKKRMTVRRRMKGRTFKEIAREAGVSICAVQGRWRNAIEAIREELDRRGRGPGGRRHGDKTA